jgi:hypothetical protein
MTGIHNKSDPISRWRAMIDALESVLLTAADEREIDPAGVEEVRRLVMVRTARRRCNTLPAAWTRRPLRVVREAGPRPETPVADEPTARLPDRQAAPPPAWHE